MFTTVACLWTIFLRRLMKKKSRYLIPSHITLNNCIPIEKRSYLKGAISIGHCNGHECIILIFVFEVFYDNSSRLLSKNYCFR